MQEVMQDIADDDDDDGSEGGSGELSYQTYRLDVTRS